MTDPLDRVHPRPDDTLVFDGLALYRFNRAERMAHAAMDRGDDRSLANLMRDLYTMAGEDDSLWQRINTLERRILTERQQ